MPFFFQVNTLTSPLRGKDINTTGSQMSCSPLTGDGLKACVSNYAFSVPVREPQEKSSQQADIVYALKKKSKGSFYLGFVSSKLTENKGM